MQVVSAYEMDKGHSGFKPLKKLLDSAEVNCDFPSLSHLGQVLRQLTNEGAHSQAAPTCYARVKHRNVFNDSVVICYYLVRLCSDFDAWYSSLWNGTSTSPPLHGVSIIISNAEDINQTWIIISSMLKQHHGN